MCPDSSSSLGKVVRSRLRSSGKTQLDLARALSVSPAELSKRLSAQKPMRDAEVVRLAEALRLPVPQLLLLAAVARCKAREREVKKKLRTAGDSVAADMKTGYEDEKRRCGSAQRAYEELLRSANSVKSETRSSRQEYITLEDFPNSFANPCWVVIVGDRRERPVKGPGDMIGLSIASTDFMYLHCVPLPWDTTVLRSDKILLVAEEDRLARLLRANLLVIGSPAVSLGTRAILHKVGATFMFNIGDEDYKREQDLYKDVGLQAPGDVMQEFISRKDVAEELFDLLNTFRKSGFIDPIDFKGIRGRAVPNDTDYGMVALARNPWSDEHFVCVCAGVHGGGTAGAVQLLSSPKSFSERPWGGVFKVGMSNQLSWETRFENLTPRWETHPYNPNKYLKDIDTLISNYEALVDRGTLSPTGQNVKTVRDLLVSRNTLINVRDFASRLAGKAET